MADDDVTLGELARLIRRVEEGQQAMLRDINQRMSRTVSLDVYTVQHQAAQEEIAELKQEISAVRQEVRDAEQQRVADRRWWIAAIAVPIGLVMLEYVIPLVGGGSV